MWALIAAAGLAASPPAPDLSWLAGYWLSCKKGSEVSETWSDQRGGMMLGTSITHKDGKVSFEFARILSSASGTRFLAMPSGQAPTEFVMTQADDKRIMFENSAHDFPQRVIYQRDGANLSARIEGQMNGKLVGVDWLYGPAQLNSRCAD